MTRDAILSELLRLLARRGELTAELEQTDLAIARQRGLFEGVLSSVPAEPAAIAETAAPVTDSAPTPSLDSATPSVPA